MNMFISVLRAEWLKQQRSLAIWIALLGGMFTPGLIAAIRVLRPEGVPELYARPDFWLGLWTGAWESMAVLLLPLGAILTTTLITQIEYRNNAWKQVHTLPVHLAVIYAAKLLVIVLIVLQVFVVFNIALVISGLIPPAVLPGVPFPSGPLPLERFALDNVRYFIGLLPIVALQFLISLRVSSFLTPIGLGTLMWVLSLGTLSWKYAYLLPYGYTVMDYLGSSQRTNVATPVIGLLPYALGYFALFTAVGLGMYLTKHDKS
jgi:lantibiotic transport system permease protein